MNVGIRPTFGGGATTCEVHILGARGSFLGKTLDVELVRRLRSERCFPTLDALQRQIRRDIVSARRLLARRPSA